MREVDLQTVYGQKSKNDQAVFEYSGCLTDKIQEIYVEIKKQSAVKNDKLLQDLELKHPRNSSKQKQQLKEVFQAAVQKCKIEFQSHKEHLEFEEDSILELVNGHSSKKCQLLFELICRTLLNAEDILRVWMVEEVLSVKVQIEKVQSQNFELQERLRKVCEVCEELRQKLEEEEHNRNEIEKNLISSEHEIGSLKVFTCQLEQENLQLLSSRQDLEEDLDERNPSCKLTDSLVIREEIAVLEDKNSQLQKENDFLVNDVAKLSLQYKRLQEEAAQLRLDQKLLEEVVDSQKYELEFLRMKRDDSLNRESPGFISGRLTFKDPAAECYQQYNSDRHNYSVSKKSLSSFKDEQRSVLKFNFYERDCRVFDQNSISGVSLQSLQFVGEQSPERVVNPLTEKVSIRLISEEKSSELDEVDHIKLTIPASNLTKINSQTEKKQNSNNVFEDRNEKANFSDLKVVESVRKSHRHSVSDHREYKNQAVVNISVTVEQDLLKETKFEQGSQKPFQSNQKQNDGEAGNNKQASSDDDDKTVHNLECSLSTVNLVRKNIQQKKELKELKQYIDHLERQQAEYESQLTDTESEAKFYKRELSKQMGENILLKSQIQSFEVELQSSQAQVQRLFEENQNLQSTLAGKASEIEENNLKSQAQKNQFEQRVTKIKQYCKEYLQSQLKVYEAHALQRSTTLEMETMTESQGCLVDCSTAPQSLSFNMAIRSYPIDIVKQSLESPSATRNFCMVRQLYDLKIAEHEPRTPISHKDLKLQKKHLQVEISTQFPSQDLYLENHSETNLQKQSPENTVNHCSSNLISEFQLNKIQPSLHGVKQFELVKEEQVQHIQQQKEDLQQKLTKGVKAGPLFPNELKFQDSLSIEEGLKKALKKLSPSEAKENPQFKWSSPQKGFLVDPNPSKKSYIFCIYSEDELPSVSVQWKGQFLFLKKNFLFHYPSRRSLKIPRRANYREKLHAHNFYLGNCEIMGNGLEIQIARKSKVNSFVGDVPDHRWKVSRWYETVE